MNGEASQHLGNIYARALFDLAGENRMLDAVRNDLAMLTQLGETEPDFLSLNESPYFTSDFKAKVLRKMLAGRVSDLTLDFLMVVTSRNRLEFLPAMIESYDRLWEEAAGIVPVHVTLSSQADSAQVEKLKADLASALDKKIKLQLAVNPGILGGVVIRCGDTVVDNSVRGLFERAVKTIIDRNGKGA